MMGGHEYMKIISIINWLSTERSRKNGQFREYLNMFAHRFFNRLGLLFTLQHLQQFYSNYSKFYRYSLLKIPVGSSNSFSVNQLSS